MQLQVQFIIYFLPVSSGFHFHTHAFRSLLRVLYALRTVYVTPVTSQQHAPHHGYNAVAGRVPPVAIYCALVGTPSWQNWSKMWESWNIVGPYIPYDLQTKGEMCAKFGSDRFRNVDLYMFHTKKQTFIFICKIIINKIINYCIVMFLRYVQWFNHFSKMQLSTANLIRTRL